MDENRDIVAGGINGDVPSSIGALAAYISRCCGHVWVDDRIISQGYRFYAWMNDEIPHFFVKRFACGDTMCSITLQAGLALDGDDPFESCESHSEAISTINSDKFESSLWKAIISIEAASHTVFDIAAPLFVAQHPAEFQMIANELVALGAVQGSSCPMCSESQIRLVEE